VTSSPEREIVPDASDEPPVAKPWEPTLVKAVNDYMAFENKIFQHASDVRSALNYLKNIPELSPSQLSL